MDTSAAPALDDSALNTTETNLRTLDPEKKTDNNIVSKSDVTKDTENTKKKSKRASQKTKKSKRRAKRATSSDTDSSEDVAGNSDSDSSDSDTDDSDSERETSKKSRFSKRHSQLHCKKDKKSANKDKKKRHVKKPVPKPKTEESSSSDSSDSDEAVDEAIETRQESLKVQDLSQKVQDLELFIAEIQQRQQQQQLAAQQFAPFPQFGRGTPPGSTFPQMGGIPGFPLSQPAGVVGLPLSVPGGGLSPPFVTGTTPHPVTDPANTSPKGPRSTLTKVLDRRRGARVVPSRAGSKDADTDEAGPEGSEGKKSKQGKKGTKIDFKRVDWVWDSELYIFKLQDTVDVATDSQYDDYIFHVRRIFDCDHHYRSTVIDIKSKLLRECLQDVIGNVKGVSLVDDTPKIDPNLLFLYLEEFRSHRKHLNQAQPAGDSKKERKRNQKRLDNKRKHLRILVKYLDEDFADVKQSLYPMLDNGLITFDLLWALWKPNTLAYGTTYGSPEEPRAFKVELAERQSSLVKGDFYYIDGKYFEFDGKRFGYGALSEEIPEFRGARKITSLPVYPLSYHKDEEKLRKDLVERGKKFVTLSGVHYKAYSGMAYVKRKKTVLRFNIQQSRIMIDPAIFRRINPNYYVSLVRPKDHDLLSDDELSSDDDSDNCGCGSSDEDDRPQFVTKVFKTANGQLRMARIPKALAEQQKAAEGKLDSLPVGSNKGSADDSATDEATPEGENTEESTISELSDEEYLIASPVVLGFSFAEKQWLEFTVSNVREIHWNEDAWDSLVMEPQTKDLIQALVKSRKYSAAQTIDDVIQGKGKGLVTVLHGPPGTGKTLTAEGISELLKCPLYMASAGELGTDSRYLESELQKILDICHAWGAILLLDEADVFLEKRNMHDIHRNALVSIFLRQLEYFQGILFLTTNRVETFDEAFQSRIHIALRYDALDSKAKKAIFKMFIERVRTHGKLELEEFSDDELEALARKELNGREIKNVIGSAQDLAVNKGQALGMKHIRQVLDVHAKFGRDLKGGSGYEDAMRSYF